MLQDGRVVIDVTKLLVPFQTLFFALSRTIAWTFALTVVGAAIMRIFKGFGYSRRPLSYGADSETYNYSSLVIHETPRWAARLLGWTKPKRVAYYSDQYNRWFLSTGADAENSKELQRIYDMFVTRRELRKSTGFIFVVGKGEKPNTPQTNQQPQIVGPPPRVTPQVYAMNTSCQIPKIAVTNGR